MEDSLKELIVEYQDLVVEVTHCLEKISCYASIIDRELENYHMKILEFEIED